MTLLSLVGKVLGVAAAGAIAAVVLSRYKGPPAGPSQPQEVA